MTAESVVWKSVIKEMEKDESTSKIDRDPKNDPLLAKRKPRDSIQIRK